jgi:nonsense-mediated mRNA decay protein 3
VKVCLKCGAETPLISQLCHTCVRQNIELSKVLPAINMVCCKACYSLKIPGTWLEFSDLESSVSHFVTESIEWNSEIGKTTSNLILKQLDPQKFRVNIECEGDYQGLLLDANLKTEVQIKFQVCQTCSRLAGGYYEAILQVRTKRKEILNKAVEEIYNLIDSGPSEFFTTDSGPVRGGYDFQLSSSDKARTISRDLMVKFGGHVTETNTLVGRKDGRDLLRHTFGVRLPSIGISDYLFLDDKVWKVLRIDRRRTKLIMLSSPFSQKMVEVDTMRNVPLLDPPLEVQVISHRDSEYLLLDPFTLQTVEAISPKDWKGNNVLALRYGIETYFIWD